MKKSIIIPTYNEKENIIKVIPMIKSLGIKDLHILVVDDNSPDGTGAVVDSLAVQDEKLHIVHRKNKEGLGRAYLAGFSWALEHGADLIFEMDADLSHDPKHIPEFIEASKNFDLVLGSRYVRGGGIKNWNFFRKVISRFGNIYAGFILGVPVLDLTGGYKCYKRHVLEAIDFDAVASLGYNFQIETTYMVYKKGFTVKEIPIIFTERRHEKSKFDIKIMFEGFWRVIILKIKGF